MKLGCFFRGQSTLSAILDGNYLAGGDVFTPEINRSGEFLRKQMASGKNSGVQRIPGGCRTEVPLRWRILSPFPRRTAHLALNTQISQSLFTTGFLIRRLFCIFGASIFQRADVWTALTGLSNFYCEIVWSKLVRTTSKMRHFFFSRYGHHPSVSQSFANISLDTKRAFFTCPRLLVFVSKRMANFNISSWVIFHV